MATQRKGGFISTPPTSSSSSSIPASAATGYHNPAFTTFPQAFSQSQQLLQSYPDVIDHIVSLYDSNYSDSQFAQAIHASFHPSVEFMDPGLHLYNRDDLQAQFTYLRRWFTRFSPKEFHVAVGGEWVYIDLLMNWELAKGKIRLTVRHILKCHVENGRVVMMEDNWSVNDRVGAILGPLYEPIRWLISQPSTKYMRYRLGF